MRGVILSASGQKSLGIYQTWCLIKVERKFIEIRPDGENLGVKEATKVHSQSLPFRFMGFGDEIFLGPFSFC